MSTKKIACGIAGLTLGASALAGCVVVENGPTDEAQNLSPVTSAPECETGTGLTDPGSGENAEPSESASPRHEIVDLAPDSGRVFIVANRSGGLLSPPKVVGPWLTFWHIDGDRITYKEVVCTGQSVTEASGDVGDEQVLWDDVDPWVGDAESATSSMKRTETTIRVGFTGTATSDVAGEKEKFVKLCTDAGADVGDFVLK